MALVTSPQTIPDLNYEYYTINIDSIGQDSANNFTCHLENPIHNVVQARLIAAHIHTLDTTDHIYVSIEELDSNFNDRASNVYNGQSSLSKLRGCFASMITSAVDHGVASYLQVFKDDYPIVTQYVNPIRTISRFTVKIYDQSGNLLLPDDVTDSNHLIIKFICRKPNL